VNKDSTKEKLWIVGVLITVVGAFLISWTWGFITLAFLIILAFFKLDSEGESTWKTEERIARRVKENADRIVNPFLDKFVKKLIELVKKHSLVIGTATGIALMIIGRIFLQLRQVYLKDEGMYWYEWQKEITRTYGYLSGPLLLIGVLSLVIGFILIIRYINRRLHSADKEK